MNGNRSGASKGSGYSVGRSLHLVDIENLAGGSGANREEVVEAVEEYRSTITVGPADHVVIASGVGCW